jgi:antibiotic biosynthesis monooxygenase (ABM) superfamily enzyme
VTEPRTYTGWKVGLAIVGTCFVVYTALNLLGRAYGPKPHRAPPPVVTTVSP